MMLRVLVIVAAIASPVFAKGKPEELFFVLTAAKNDAYVLHDDVYAVTFPTKPTTKPIPFETTGGSKGNAFGAWLDMEKVGYVITVRAMPRTFPLDPATELAALRDALIGMKSGKLVSDTTTTVAGLEGRNVVASIGNGNYMTFDVLWDPVHRCSVVLSTSEHGSTRSDEAEAFVRSFTVDNTKRGPQEPDPPADGVAVKANALELVRHGDAFVVRDAAMEITFPVQPEVQATAGAVPFSLAQVTRREVDTFAVGIGTIPADTKFDPQKGGDGARDGLLKSFTSKKLRESKLTISGRTARRIVVAGVFNKTPVVAEIRMVWDAKQRRMITAMAISSEKTLPAPAKAFLDSLVLAK